MKRLLGAVFLIGLLGCKPTTPPPAASALADARQFAANFYAWYRPDSGSARNLDDVLRDRSSAIEPQLLRLIKGGQQCEGDNPQTVCDLDFDPFLDSQDPCQRYEVGGAVEKYGAYSVSVFAVCDGRRDSVPTVLAVVAHHDSTWQFVNFVYGGGQSSLRELLQEGHPK